MAKRYRVDLSDDERAILLAAADRLTDQSIAASMRSSAATVEHTRKRFVAGRLGWALSEAPRPGATPKLDGKQEA